MLAAAAAYPTARVSRYEPYALMGLLAGLVSAVVGEEVVIAHPLARTDPAPSRVPYAGPALFLPAQAWHHYLAAGAPGPRRSSSSWSWPCRPCRWPRWPPALALLDAPASTRSAHRRDRIGLWTRRPAGSDQPCGAGRLSHRKPRRGVGLAVVARIMRRAAQP